MQLEDEASETGNQSVNERMVWDRSRIAETSLPLGFLRCDMYDHYRQRENGATEMLLRLPRIGHLHRSWHCS